MKVEILRKGIIRIISVPGIVTAMKYEKSAKSADADIASMSIIFFTPENNFRDFIFFLEAMKIK